MGYWIIDQLKKAKNRKEIMKNNEIYDKWNMFMSDYSKYFKSNEEKWDETLNKVKDYINKNKCRPGNNSKNKEIRQIGGWVQNQYKYEINKDGPMRNDKIYDKWTMFVDEYGNYFPSNEEKWNEMLEKVKNYINEYNHKPSTTSKDIDIRKLGRWISTQLQNAKNRKFQMKSDEIYNKWNIFTNDYNYYVTT